MKIQFRKELENLVYGFKTKYKEGFVQSEIEELLKNYPNIDREKFNKAFWGNTCMVRNEEIITYHCDVYTALLCGIEERDIKASEWD